MKKYFLMLFSIIAASVAVHAQDSTTEHHPHHRASAVKQQRMDVMEQLQLTDNQKASVQQLREAQRIKMDSIRNSSMTSDEKMARMKAVREEGRRQIEEVLTPQQKSRMQQMRAAQMEKRNAHRQDADTMKK